MDEYAKLLTSVAALLSAIAWPVALVAALCFFRHELKATLQMAPVLLSRLKKASLAGVAVELDRVSHAEAESDADKSGRITPLQIETANRIAIQTRDIGTLALIGEMDRLCLEYDAIRRTMEAGVARTRAMTGVVVRMRALAPSVVDALHAYKGSGSPGSRLAAITMMQMAPRIVDLHWLKERFAKENPFIFYHAALAIQNFAGIASTIEEKDHLRNVVHEAKSIIEGFAGVPDRGTLEVLNTLLVSLPRY